MIYFVRHGQTKLNHASILQGRSDQPLNENGRAEARAVGDFFRGQGVAFELIYSSPLKRAVETAQLIRGDNFGTEIVLDERLIEMDYGPYEGMDLTNPAPEVLDFFRDFVHHPAPEGMEPLSAVVERLGLFLEELRSGAADKNVLISTHAIAMKGALEYLNPTSGGAYWSKYIGNCAVYTSQLAGGRYTVPEELTLRGAS